MAGALDRSYRQLMANGAPQTPTETPSEAELNAVSTKQAAVIGLVGVLLAALLSIMAGVISAKLAGDTAAETVANQLSGETERARSEFLREQRLVLYSALVNTHEDAQARERAWRLALRAGRANTTAHEENVGVSVGRFDARDGQVEVLASRAVRDAYDDLNAAHFKMSRLLRAERRLISSKAPKEELARAASEVEVAAREVGRLEDALFDLMRQDLGNR